MSTGIDGTTVKLISLNGPPSKSGVSEVPSKTDGNSGTIENTTKSSLIIVPVPVPVLTTGPLVVESKLTVNTSSAS